MIFDLLRDTPGAEDRADVCVVGAGAAGICLAVELARQGKRVLVLEGGGAEIEEAAQEPYRSEVVGHEHRGVHVGRFRAHGGTTTKWGGQILPLNAEDFEERKWIAESGWPFAKDTLLPFYERALELEGVGGSIREDAEVWRELGLPVPSIAKMQSYFSRWCPEPNFARLHRKTLESSESVRIWLHANVIEMVMDGEAVTGLRCKTQAGKEAVFTADAFVFCMGTIECVRFFLQPRKDGLPWNQSGLLGKHFQDHVDADVADVVPRDHQKFSEMFDNVFLRGYKYHPKLRLNANEQQVQGLLNCGVTMTFASDSDEALADMKTTAKLLLRAKLGEVDAGSIVRMLKNAPLLIQQTWRYARHHRIGNPGSPRIKLRAHCEQRPDGESSITLNDERDSLGLLRTKLDWRISELELKTLREIAKTAAVSLSGVADVRPDTALLAGDANFGTMCDDSNHHMGGMRMAVFEYQGVVNPELRLHGTRNCFVCSGAVFPTSGFSNPTHTVIALALRLADHLSGL